MIRNRTLISRLSLTIALLLAAALPAAAAQTQFLSGPAVGDALTIARAYLDAQREALGLTAADLTDYVVTDRYGSVRSGLTHIYLRQRHRGIEVVLGEINLNLTARGEIVNLGNGFIPDLARQVNTEAPEISAEEAIRRAGEQLGLAPPDQLLQLENRGGPALEAVFSGAGLSQDEIPARLVYQPVAPGQVRLAWDLVLRLPGDQHWYDLRIDAVDGRLLAKDDWVSWDSYRVVPFPFESPGHPGSSHSVVSAPADATASPFGWHDTNGAAGAEFTDTRGNNAFAQEDVDANNSGGTRPDGGGSLDFDFAFNSAQEPAEGTNQQAAIVNLFYWNNIVHDVLYHYGFDEPAGNFQENNYGNGGLGSDPVQADAQDGSGTNNANFSTPPDGGDGRMQMYVWTAPPQFTVNSPVGIAGDYPAASAGFGAALDGIGITGDVVLVNDGFGTTSDACCNDTNTPCGVGTIPGLTGMIAILDRGTCEFGTKVKGAENNGAIAAIVVNNQGDGLVSMGGGANGGSVTISSAFLGQTDGTLIKDNLPANVTMKKSAPNRDSDFDSAIMAHEYTHGISNRLTGGPSNVGCLQNNEQMGEGWSDFVALVLTAQPADTATTSRGIGTYSSFQNPDGPGIRTYPYTTDMGVNLHTYDSIKTAAIPHGVGSVWAVMLWEMYWGLVDKYGFDPDLYGGSDGNNMALQLVIDGMKLQVCSPHFVNGRDAILLADQNDFSGANQCVIWRAFAKRGLGSSANAGSSGSTTDGTEAFDLPAACAGEIFSDGFETGATNGWSAVVP